MAGKNGQVNQAMDEIMRAKDAESKQPRFTPDAKSTAQFFNQIYGFVKGTIFDEPPYTADSRKRDTWLGKVVPKEPYLNGILQSMVSIDKNRGFTVTGGRNQVIRIVNILHNFQVAPDSYGMRDAVSVSAKSYYNFDLGVVTETGRSIPNGPLAKLYAVDSTKCHLTGNLDTPLKYPNAKKLKQDWTNNDYFRVASFPNTDEAKYGLGYCFASRCIELAKLLVSVFEHDRERLGSKAPKGILTINGLTQDQWLLSLEESTDERSQLEREYYSGVQVLTGDALNPVTVGLTALSNLPEQFDHRTFVDMIIYGYALNAGYDPREFWPVSSGALGTATESESQHRKATNKGGLDFWLAYQGRLQEELPDSIEFEIEQRDVEGDISETTYKQSQLNIISQMYEKGEITYDEMRQLAVEANLIHEEWTTQEEDTTVSDTDDEGELLEKARVQRAIQKFPNDDIVQYSFNADKYRTIRKAGVPRKFQMRVTRKVPEPKPPEVDTDKILSVIEERFAQLERNAAESHKQIQATPVKRSGILDDIRNWRELSQIKKEEGAQADAKKRDALVIAEALNNLASRPEPPIPPIPTNRGFAVVRKRKPVDNNKIRLLREDEEIVIL